MKYQKDTMKYLKNAENLSAFVNFLIGSSNKTLFEKQDTDFDMAVTVP